jgi:predicted Holliday junction resolvase-like endonuclease
MHAPDIILIILSIFLAIFLLSSIVLLVILIKVINNIRRVVQRVDETTENMGELLKYTGRKMAPAAMAALMRMVFKRAKSKVKRKERD